MDDLKNSYKMFYERYKALIGSATEQQVLNKYHTRLRRR
jgi:hypothetical protein